MHINLLNFLFYCILTPKLYAKYKKINLGKNCRIATKNWGSEPYLIEIGNHVHITKDVEFITHDGSVWVFRDEISDFDIFGKIVIKDNTYVGNGTIILPGVTIGNNCIIGAKSLVTKSIPDNCVVGGVPAKYISSTVEFKNKVISYNARTKKLSYYKKKQILTNKSFNQFIKKASMIINEE